MVFHKLIKKIPGTSVMSLIIDVQSLSKQLKNTGKVCKIV